MLVTFRRPTMADFPVMFAWQRHPDTRLGNPRHQFPEWEAQLSHVAKCAADPKEMLMLMCVGQDWPVGFIVFFKRDEGIWFGIRVAPGLEHRGLEGSAVEYAKQRWGSRLCTSLHSEEEEKSFASFGFERQGDGNLWRYAG